MADAVAFFEAMLGFVAELTVCALELLGILIIAVGSARAVWHLLRGARQRYNVIVELGKALALSLEFKMGAEIVNTAIVRDLAELATLAVVIALRAILSLLIHWELKSERRAEDVGIRP